MHWFSECVWGTGGFKCGAFDLTSHSSQLRCSSGSGWAPLSSTELSSPDVHMPPTLPDNRLPDLGFKTHTHPMKHHREITQQRVFLLHKLSAVLLDVGCFPHKSRLDLWLKTQLHSPCLFPNQCAFSPYHWGLRGFRTPTVIIFNSCNTCCLLPF